MIGIFNIHSIPPGGRRSSLRRLRFLIQPSNESGLRWLYPLLGVRGASSLIGVVELTAALLICARHWQPKLSALGSLLAAGTFLVTLSFLVSTPGVLAPTNPFGGFLMKDVMLLGAALSTAAEALEASRQRTGALLVAAPSAR